MRSSERRTPRRTLPREPWGAIPFDPGPIPEGDRLGRSNVRRGANAFVGIGAATVRGPALAAADGGSSLGNEGPSERAL